MLAAFYFVPELEHFYNNGFGWICKRCEEEEVIKTSESEHSRLLSEGEAESKNPRLSTPALAKWKDEKREALMCERCGIEEQVG